jgi:nucleoid DNA-binding protein
MNKPFSMSVKEWLIKKMAINMVISEKIIDQVVTHQFDSANDALNVHKTVELSGFGKFHFNNKKAVKQLEKWNKIKEAYEKILANKNTTDEKRKNTEVRLENLLISIKTLKPKIDESDANI